MAELAILAGTAAAATAGGAATVGAAAAPAVAAAAAPTIGLGTLATGASLAGSGLAAAGAIKQGQHQRAIGEFNAREMERAAEAERAAGIRKSQEKRREMERVLSEQRARATKSGAGLGETEGFLDIVGDTAERGQLISELEIASGEERARGREGQAALARYQGEAAKGIGYVKAAGYGLDAVKGIAADDELLGYIGVPSRKKSALRYA